MSDPVRSAREAFAAANLEPRTWANEPGFRYASHSHAYHKVLYCLKGSIVFHTPEEDVTLFPGDRLDLPPGTEHSATVGPQGVTCMEAALFPPASLFPPPLAGEG